MLKKPKMWSEWRGQVGNKYRVYFVSTAEGNRHTLQSKASALKQYESAMRYYKKIKAYKKDK